MVLTFTGPGVAPKTVCSSAHREVRCVEGLLDAVYSRLPEHAGLKSHIAEFNLQSVSLSESIKDILPDELADFWEAFAGWFAMYSTGPLLANRFLAREALAQETPERAEIVENWRSGPWWSGRYDISPAILGELQNAGVPVRVRPPNALRGLRRMISGHYGARVLLRELQIMQALRNAALANPHHEKDPTACDVLWLSVGASSAQLMKCLIPALEEMQGLRSEILDFHYYESGSGCRLAGLPYSDIEEFADEASFLAGYRSLRRWPGWWKTVKRSSLPEPLAADFSLPMQQRIRERLKIVLSRDAGSWLVRAEACRRALDVYKPRVVVAFHVYGPPVAPMVVEAARRGIPAVCLQHGVIGPRSLALPCLPYNHKLLFSEYAHDIVKQVGHPGMGLTVTGHSLYDKTAIASQSPLPADLIAFKENVRGLVLLCAQYNEHLYHTPKEYWLQTVAETCRALNVRLLIKPHPSDTPENMAIYHSLAEAADKLVQVVAHGRFSLDELLTACDAMITRDSTVVFEANALDKPVITINLSCWEEELPYAATGGALGVYAHADIRPAIEAVLFDEATRSRLAAGRSDFLQMHTGPRDGQATRRITDVIAAYAAGRTP